MKTLIRSINRSPLRCGFFTLAIALCWFALSPPLKALDCPSECGNDANTGVGVSALNSLTSGINNTAVGKEALRDLTTGGYNVAIGSGALRSNTAGAFNMAIGTEALRDNTADFNLAIGFRVGFTNTTGRHLTGIGAAALQFNTIGNFNTAIGAAALQNNTTASFNVAVGDAALGAFNGTTAFDGANTALGSLALTAETSGQENVAVGRRALQSLTDGDNNVALGWRSGDSLATGSLNTLLGSQAGNNYTGAESNNIIIGGGIGGTAGESNTIRIGSNLPSDGINISDAGLAVQAFTIGSGLTGGGIQYLATILGQSVSIAPNFSTTNGASNCTIGGIFNQTPAAGSHLVVVGPNDRLADATLSSRRFKKDIAPIDKISEGILALKPVTFHFKNDDTNYPQFGLVAEDVAEVNPDWITRDPQGEIYGVRYDTIPILLLNEFLKEHKKVEEQQATIAQLKSTVAQQQKGMEVLTAQLKEQAAQIQKVSAQLEASKPAPQVVNNP
jgi:hypothetical protein